MTAIFHITHVDNLPGILQEGGLWCDRERLARKIIATGIAHQHIKNRRAKRPVPVAAGGALADYVPFSFAPRSPMLFTINKGNVEGYAGGQGAVVHLVSTVETAMRLGIPWCFTDGHADMAMSQFFGDWRHRDKIAWDVMKLEYWNDSLEFPDRKRRRQAEFLVHGFFPWTAVERIGVGGANVVARVGEILAKNEHRPSVAIEPSWYY